MGDLLKRLGMWTILFAVVGLWIYPSVFPDAAETEKDVTTTPATQVALVGGVLFIVGSALELMPAKREACRNCGRRAAPGSVLCEEHRRELVAAASQTLGAFRPRV